MKKNFKLSIIISTLFFIGCAETRTSTQNPPKVPQATKVCKNMQTVSKRKAFIQANHYSLTYPNQRQGFSF